VGNRITATNRRNPSSANIAPSIFSHAPKLSSPNLSPARLVPRCAIQRLSGHSEPKRLDHAADSPESGRLLENASPSSPNPDEPLVSIGVPTYNRPAGLRRTLECLTRQTYRNTEILISDNASPGDETQAIATAVQREDSRVQYFRQPQNFGAANNFKAVLNRARGEFFLWAADDDLFNEDYIRPLLAALRARPGSVLAFGRLEALNFETSERVPYPKIAALAGERELRERMRTVLLAEESEGKANLWHALHRREALVRAWDERLLGCWAGDCLAIFRLAQFGSFVHAPEALLTKGWNPEVSYNKPDPKEHHRELQDYFQAYRNEIQASPLDADSKADLLAEVTLKEALWFVRNPILQPLNNSINKLIAEATGKPLLPPSPAQNAEAATEADKLAFYRQFVQPGELCFDIGANRGNRTEVLLALGARVLAVEPQTECADLLAKRFSENQSFQLVRKALDSTVGKAEILICDCDTISSLSTEWIQKVKESRRFEGLDWTRTETVATTTLDELIREYGRPVFCKIDVEGFELSVLKGLSSPIQCLCFEFTPEYLEPALACVDHLAGLGGAVFNFSAGESLAFDSTTWLSPEAMKDRLRRLSARGDNVLFGDIYAKFLKTSPARPASAESAAPPVAAAGGPAQTDPASLAGFASHHYQRHNQRRLEHLSGLGLPIAGKTVLEVGAGVGDHTGFFLDRGCCVASTEGRRENVELLRKRYSWIHTSHLDLNAPDASGLPQELYQIVYCYGLLYHLDRPAEAIAFLGRHCSEMLLLETCVSFGSGKHVNLCGEPASDATQSISGTGCRPTRDWVFGELRRHFPFVYMPVTQPWHEEFPVDWSTPDPKIPLSRAVFVAGKTPIVNPLLANDIPMLQRRA